MREVEINLINEMSTKKNKKTSFNKPKKTRVVYVSDSGERKKETDIGQGNKSTKKIRKMI